MLHVLECAENANVFILQHATLQQEEVWNVRSITCKKERWVGQDEHLMLTSNANS